ncbi:hypothetical protein VTL71DRAFT_158 [Oculimacula yallundae]|uniref:Ribosomal protein L16 n=1 Tax=Oculimacula yallundae TaxID=86028 RepID=A0ABR4D0C7_9HELO
MFFPERYAPKALRAKFLGARLSYNN